MKILFLGYDENKTRLIGFLRRIGHEVIHTADKVKTLDGYDVIISFGYRHMIKPKVLKDHKVYNLHISYLPWNRGANPNFWAWYDGTQHGVTILLINEGVDTGPIVYQKVVHFAPIHNTFAKTYQVLIWEMEDLFLKYYTQILTGNCIAIPQSKYQGSTHKVSDLPDWVRWDMNVNVQRMKQPVGKLFEVTGRKDCAS